MSPDDDREAYYEKEWYDHMQAKESAQLDREYAAHLEAEYAASLKQDELAALRAERDRLLADVERRKQSEAKVREHDNATCELLWKVEAERDSLRAENELLRGACRDFERAAEEKHGGVLAERDSLRGLVKELEAALACFVGGYPDREWEGLLHEQGCPGVNWRPDARDEEWPCKCDGDFAAETVRAALSKLSSLNNPPPKEEA